jgi:putative sugar O-methyltransferase
MAGSHDLSEFWREHLRDEKRRNYPSFGEMLVMRRGFTYPLADRANVGDIDEERAYAEGAWYVISRSMPQAWFDRFEESSLGAPVAFELGGHTLTAGGVVNGLTAHRIARWCERAGLARRALRVLEIGAGYGQVAHQLLQVLDIESYAVCDLPENLFLGAFYLQGNFPERRAAFLGPSDVPPAAAQLVFSVPPLVDRLEGPFDLIVNSYSFQEMNRESVDKYFKHAERTLADDGLFYSLNAHGKAGIERPSQYRADLFEIRGLRPVRRFPWQVFATNPYELVMRRRTDAPLDEASRADIRKRLDALGSALQLGLHDELVPLCRRFSSGSLGAGERRQIDALHRFAYEESADAKRSALASAPTELPQAVKEYLLGSLEFAAGNHEAARDALTRSIEGLAENHARVRALIFLAGLARLREDEAEGAARESAAEALAPHLTAEIRRLSRDQPSSALLLASQLSLTETQQPDRGLASRLRNRMSILRGSGG